MVASFSLERVQKSPASFDPKKLWAFQDHHMQELSLAERTERVVPFLEAVGACAPPASAGDRGLVAEIVLAAGDRIKAAGDILDYTDFFTADERLTYDETAFQKRLVKPAEAVTFVTEIRRLLAASADFSEQSLEGLVRGFVEERGIKLGQVVHALRVALTGKSVGFGLFETMAILGRQTCLARIDRAMELALSLSPHETDGGESIEEHGETA